MSDSSEPLPNFNIRDATPVDIPEILRQRRAMYEDMDYKDAAALSAMVSISASYLAKAMAEGSFRSWLASVETRIVAGGAIIISPWPAHPYDLECPRRILQTTIAWCQREGFARVDLHASPEGRHLYESLGFEPSNEMRLKLKR